MGTRPFHGKDTEVYEGTYDKTKVVIIGWEYGQFPTNSGRFGTCKSPSMPTHAVAWMRPIFQSIPPEGFVWVDAHDCWPDSGTVVSESTGKVVQRPDRGTMVLAPLPKAL